MPLLTDKQSEVLEAIRRHISLTGHSPTVREIGQAVQLSSSCSVQKHLDTLVRLGKIRRSQFKYRSIELADNSDAPTSSDAAGMSSLMIPLLGTVAGGVPISVEPEIDPELLALPASLLPRCDRRIQADACALRNYTEAPFFAVTVRGDSMIGAGIADGDIVVASRQQSARNGDIVIAMVGEGEATVKRFYKEPNAIRLEPENPSFEPLITRDAKVMGKVALSIKRF